MTYATPEERLQLRKVYEREGNSFNYTLLVNNGERKDELPCTSLEHALDMWESWSRNIGVEYAEIFRVLPDGTLNTTSKIYINNKKD